MSTVLQLKNQQPVAIIGAGLAGLSCAKTLKDQRIECVVLEASDGVGGRVRTDVVDGCRLDRGFQVFQTAYPEARRMLDYDQLDLVELEPGALVRYGGRWCRFSDPLRKPRHAWQTLFNPLGTFGDRLKLLRMQFDIKSRSSQEWLADADDQTTLEFLRKYRFSESFLESFLRPWLSGIFLESDLATSGGYFAFVFQMLSAGPIAYPREGIQAIPDQLAASVGEGQIRLQCPVQQVHTDGDVGYVIQLAAGEQVHASATVLATDLPTAIGLADGNFESRKMNSTVCCYYVAPKPPVRDPVLLLNGEAQGPINHVFVSTNAAPSLTPDGQALISVSLVGKHARSFDPQEVRGNLQEWFGSSVETWRELRVYHIENALPEQVPGFYTQQVQLNLPEGVFMCGDHLETTSVNGALKSGREAADSVIEFLRSKSGASR